MKKNNAHPGKVGIEVAKDAVDARSLPALGKATDVHTDGTFQKLASPYLGRRRSKLRVSVQQPSIPYSFTSLKTRFQNPETSCSASAAGSQKALV